MPINAFIYIKVKRKSRSQRNSERERNVTKSTPETREATDKELGLMSLVKETNWNNHIKKLPDAREDLDFLFDEEIETKNERRHDFSLWYLIAYLSRSCVILT